MQAGAVEGASAWTVSDVSHLLRKFDLVQQADAVEENLVDGRLFLELTQDELQGDIDQGGLALKPLQVKRIRRELGSSQEVEISALKALVASLESFHTSNDARFIASFPREGRIDPAQASPRNSVPSVSTRVPAVWVEFASTVYPAVLDPVQVCLHNPHAFCCGNAATKTKLS